MGVISGGNVIAGAQPRTFTSAGAPTDGTSGTFAGAAPPGSLLTDETNGDTYQNTNTSASPTWTLLSDDGVLLPATTEGRLKMADAFFSSEAIFDSKAEAGVIGEDRLAAAQLTGRAVAEVANVNIIGGVPVLFRITATALSADVDVVMTHKVRVVDVWCVAVGGAGGAGDTITVKNGATAITNAIDMNVADNTIVRAGTIDDAQHAVAAAGTLRVSGASAVTCEVYVLGFRSA